MMRRMKRRTQGFSLMELMVVVTLVGTILAIGAPSFTEFRRNNRLTGAGNDFLGALLLARTEAIKRQRTVSLCASDNAGSATPSCSAGAYSGWIVFEDRDGNCTRDAATEELLRAEGPIETAVNTSATGSCVPFAATGFVAPRAGDPADGVQRVLFCDDRGVTAQQGTAMSAGRGVMVTRTGRSRVTRDISSGTDTDLTKWAISCP
jgi:type IV fimbrial biogenesis protein FimT